MPTPFASLVPALRDLGFFSRVPSGRMDEALREAATYPFASVVHRSYFADAEELAEGQILAIVATTRDFLAHEGVAIDVTFRPSRTPQRAGPVDPDETPHPIPIATMTVSESRGGPRVAWHESYDERGYVIHRGTRRTVIWSHTDPEGASWMLASMRTIALLNELLAAHGSSERAWAIHAGGNEMEIVFATPEQARLLNAHFDEAEQLTDGRIPAM